MSSYSLVAPNAIMRRIVEQPDDLIGDYLMCICTDVLEDPELYRRIRKEHPKTTIIMDNGVIETGEPLPSRQLLSAAQICGANVIILPDFMNEADATIASATSAAERWTTILPADIGFMAVVQGWHKTEYMECAHWLSSIDVPNRMYWGIPKMAETNLGSRAEIVNYCYQTKPDWPIHLLGFSNSIVDDIRCAKMPGVMGIDSAVPVRIGAMGIVCRATNIDKMHIPRDNFWELYTTGSKAIVDIHNITESVEVMRELFQ